MLSNGGNDMSGNGTALATRSTAPVAVRTDNLDTLTVARMLAESGFFGEVRDAGKALAKILAGQELGMGPIASLMGVYYQQGKVTYSANIMAAAVKRSGIYTYRIRRHDTTACEIEFFERGESVGTSAFTIEEARLAGLTSSQGKGNWEKYPRNMLFARAMSNGCKWFCPDIFGGATPYTPDEISPDAVVGDDGEIRPAIVEVQSTTAPAEAEQSGWTDGAQARWAAGEQQAREIGATIPTMPDAGASRGEVVAALRKLGDNIVARRQLVSDLKDAVQRVQDLGGSYDMPDDVPLLPDGEIRELIEHANAAVAAAEAA